MNLRDTGHWPGLLVHIAVATLLAIAVTLFGLAIGGAMGCDVSPLPPGVDAPTCPDGGCPPSAPRKEDASLCSPLAGGCDPRDASASD